MISLCLFFFKSQTSSANHDKHCFMAWMSEQPMTTGSSLFVQICWRLLCQSLKFWPLFDSSEFYYYTEGLSERRGSSLPTNDYTVSYWKSTLKHISWLFLLWGPVTANDVQMLSKEHEPIRPNGKNGSAINQKILKRAGLSRTFAITQIFLQQSWSNSVETSHTMSWTYTPGFVQIWYKRNKTWTCLVCL